MTPWYGENIPGGAEMQLRGIVKHLVDENIEIEVLTTCVKDSLSDWNVNYHKEGIEVSDRVLIRRFPVRKRNVLEFEAINYKLIHRLRVTEEEEYSFFREMVNSPKLYDYMKLHQEEYDLFVFIPYLFGTTYYGMQICPEKSVLISCFHDEGYVYMKCLKEVIQLIKGIIFLSRPEQELANHIFDLSGVQQGVLGAGIDSDYVGQEVAFREKYKQNSPFIVYAGRKAEGKNVHLLIQYFSEYKKRNQSELKLLLIGGGRIDIPKSYKEDIIDLGFVSVHDKFDAYAASQLLCQPSRNESFSLVIMESWLCGKPVLVHEGCAVTKNFVIESQGGLYFNDYYDFEGCINYFLEHRNVTDKMGQNGKKFVEDNYLWNAIITKLLSFFESCIESRSEKV